MCVKKHCIWRIAIMLIMTFAILISANNAYAANVTSSGVCGENLTWTLDDEGVLTISGTGDMYTYDFDRNKYPWYYSTDSIKHVVIEEGVTSISPYVFMNLGNYEGSVVIPNSVTTMGDSVFSNSSIESVSFGSGLNSIPNNAFWGCSLSGTLTIPSNVETINSFAFVQCENLTSLDLSNSLISIGENAFAHCTH